jgi:dihydroflavonol-4-reductase
MPAMAKTLVTGGSGFIGSHLVRALAARGDELRLLVRRRSRLDHLADIEYERAVGDVTDRRAVRRAMEGVERVFHVAGRTSMRSADREVVFRTNVTGSRIVFEEALAAEVQRVVHTSSSGAIGVAKPRGAVDERQTYNIAHLGLTYPNAKHEAEMEALRLAARGLPIVIVNPTFALGPDDPSRTSMGLVRRFLLRRIPLYTDGALNVVDVRDVAEGHLLADRKGEVGERYLLGARNFTLHRLFADLARISGVPPPRLKLPGEVVLAAARAGSRLRMPLPTTPEEVLASTLWWTYRNTRARRELGFSPRPHEETLEDAVRWQREELGERVSTDTGPEGIAIHAVGRVVRLGERLLGR